MELVARVSGILFSAMIGLGAGSEVHAIPYTVNVDDTFEVDFRFTDSFSGIPGSITTEIFDTPDTVYQGRSDLMLFNGATALSGVVQQNSFGVVGASWISPEQWPFPPQAWVINFDSIRNKSIDGRFLGRLASGTSLTFDPERDVKITARDSSDVVGYGTVSSILINGTTIWENPLPQLSSSLLFRSNSTLYRDGSWGIIPTLGIDADALLIPGFDHVGLNLDEKVFESHPGYKEGTYVSADETEQIFVHVISGVQQQHSRETFLYDAKEGAVSRVDDTLEVDIPHDVAESMAQFIQSQTGKGFQSIAKSEILPGFSNIFDFSALAPSVQKGANGTYTCVGLVEWAAEMAGVNGGQGFIPTAMEGSEVAPLLSPELLSYAVTHPDVVTNVLNDGSFLSGFFDPVDFLITDPSGRRLGHTVELGTVNEIPGAFYTGNGGIEEFFLPNVIAGNYQLQLFSLGSEYVASIVGKGGTIFSDRRMVPIGETYTASFQAVPVPASIFMLVSGFACLSVVRRRAT